MQYFYRYWPLSIIAGITLIVLVSVGCGPTRAINSDLGSPDTLPVEVTLEAPLETEDISGGPEETPLTETEDISIGTGETPSTEAEDASMGSEGSPSTPLVVQLSLSKAPKLNEEIEVVLKIQAYQDSPGTTAQIELPPEAKLVSGELRWEGDVKVGSPMELTIRLAFIQEGEYTIRGSALSPVSPDLVWGDDDYIYLTVKQDGGFLGFESGNNPQLTASPIPKKSN